MPRKRFLWLCLATAATASSAFAESCAFVGHAYGRTVDRDEVISGVESFLKVVNLPLDLSDAVIEAVEEKYCDYVVTTAAMDVSLKRVGARLRVVRFSHSERKGLRWKAKGRREGMNALSQAESHRLAAGFLRALVPEWSTDESSFDYVTEPVQAGMGILAHADDRCGCARLMLGLRFDEGPVFVVPQGLSCIVDTLDGTLLEFSWSPMTDFEVTSRTGSLPVDEARAKAKAVAFAQFGVDMAAYDMTATQGFAGVTMLPGVERRRRDVAPFELRFAWRVRAHSVQNGAQLQGLFVDIDAQTGKVLNLGWIKPKPPAR